MISYSEREQHLLGVGILGQKRWTWQRLSSCNLRKGRRYRRYHGQIQLHEIRRIQVRCPKAEGIDWAAGNPDLSGEHWRQRSQPNWPLFSGPGRPTFHPTQLAVPRTRYGESGSRRAVTSGTCAPWKNVQAVRPASAVGACKKFPSLEQMLGPDEEGVTTQIDSYCRQSLRYLEIWE